MTTNDNTPRTPTLKTFRAFTTEFLLFLEQRGGMPLDKHLRTWMQAHYNGAAADDLTKARNGQYAPLKCTTGIIAMLLDASPDTVKNTFHAREALLDFMRARGLESAAATDLERVASHVCTPIATASPETGKPPEARPHPFFVPVEALLRLGIDYMLRCVRGCRPLTNDVDEAVRWMYIRVAQQALADGPAMSFEDAIAAAERHMRISLVDYQAQARAWHKHNPWTVVLGKGTPRLHCGMSIVLPLSERAYHDILEGRRAGYEMTPADLSIPSSHLLIEACTDNPNTLSDVRLDPPTKLLICMSLQLGAFMRHGRSGVGDVFKWLSFAGTPTSRNSMISTGFVATGQNMARTGLELLERTVDLGGGKGAAFVEGLVLKWGSQQCPAAPPLD